MKIVGDFNIDMQAMHEMFEYCKEAKRYDYQMLKGIYLKALASGEEKANLTLALLMPFESKNKIRLLKGASV